MSTEPEPVTQRRPRLRARIAQIIAGSDWPHPEPTEDTTVSGYTEQMLQVIDQKFFSPSMERLAVYEDVRAMDDTMDEVSTALDTAADNAVATQTGQEDAFRITYLAPVGQEIKAIISGVLARTQWAEKAWDIARETLLVGDEFLQVVFNRDLEAVRLMYLPPESMWRNEDEQGLLLNGRSEGRWAYEQRFVSSQKFICGFYPWQIIHLRWKKTSRSPYGKSLLYTARTSFLKLQAMEEALVINWITRAFARLLFTLDTTGKGPEEAKQAIAEFKHSLTTRKIAKDVSGMEQLAVVADIFLARSYHNIGGRAEQSLTNAGVLDTSNTGYQQIRPIEYYRDRILASLRTPKAYLGLEEDINAKATLVQEDKRYQRFLASIQKVLTYGIRQTIDLQLAVLGHDPRLIPYQVEWFTQGWGDLLEDSQAHSNYATGDAQYMQLGLVDKEWVAKNHLHMSDAEFTSVQARVAASPPVSPALDVVGKQEQGDTEESEEEQ